MVGWRYDPPHPLTGFKFGRLKVLGRDYDRKSGEWYLCQCECGSQPRRIAASDLIRGITRPCGCDLTGLRFGRWTVLDRDYDTKASDRRYICQCACPSSPRSIAAHELKRGTTRSC
jgi:hypothetical protein